MSNTALILWLLVKVSFLIKKNADFLQKDAEISKLKSLGTKRYIFWDYVFICTYIPNFKFLA